MSGGTSIVEVARLAGVSASAASKALRGRYGVSAGLRRQVHVAAETLGYGLHPGEVDLMAWPASEPGSDKPGPI